MKFISPKGDWKLELGLDPELGPAGIDTIDKTHMLSFFLFFLNQTEFKHKGRNWKEIEEMNNFFHKITEIEQKPIQKWGKSFEIYEIEKITTP